MRKRNTQIHFYLNDEEFEILRGSAQYYNLTITQYIKIMCNLTPPPLSALSIAEEQAELEEWIAEHKEEDALIEEYYFETAEETIAREQAELDDC